MRYDRFLKRFERLEEEISVLSQDMYMSTLPVEILNKMNTIVSKVQKIEEHISKINR